MMLMMIMLMMMIQVSHTDWGVYTCRANNSMGEGEAMVVVKSKLNHKFRSVRASRLDNFCCLRSRPVSPNVVRVSVSQSVTMLKIRVTE